jgi:hypothetical protein
LTELLAAPKHSPRITRLQEEMHLKALNAPAVFKFDPAQPVKL